MSDRRPVWRGTLRLALVSCPVALLPARHERNNLHFHLINPKTGNRVRMQPVDAGTDRAVERGDLVRGYERDKGEYVLLGEEDFDAVRVETSRNLVVQKCVPAAAIGPLHYDSGYYLVPDGKDEAEVYAVLRQALAESGLVALSRLVLFRRERAVALRAEGPGILLQTLFEEGDLHAADDAFSDIPATKPDRALVKLARQIVEEKQGDYDPADAEDRYEARLRAVIAAKAEGQEPEPEPEEARDDNVIDLMTALRRSLKGGGKAAPARAPGKAADKTGGKTGGKTAARSASGKTAGSKPAADKTKAKPAGKAAKPAPKAAKRA
ncbi:Ku protein [Pseudoroseomonas deserti]|uniref:Non-homologous end joining protein Ku n=1 Tax=Teichococcus deserti TaxID=1817963 RepID=A0A1V2GTS4_9PROT|nr:Ku protein [Pseudoroseomonas deserti]ONG43849.1 Ku protein [Pseudoroseomonas deserti]